MKKYLFISLLIIIPMNLMAQHSDEIYDDREYTRAEIVSIDVIPIDNPQGIKLTETHITLTVLDGDMTGEEKVAIYGGESDLPQEMIYKEGDIVFIGIAERGDISSTQYISIYDIDNTGSIIFMGILLFLAIIAVGRWKGLASLFALVVTIVLLFIILIPMTLKGYPPLPFAVLISIASILITLPIIAGLKKKTLAAILGASGGIILAALLALGSGLIMNISGMITNDMLTVFYVSDITIDLRGLVLSGMIIAALGAIMDVCISIASSTAEIYNANPSISDKEAFTSVLNIGTDILGSMVNTLILAYVGSSLSLILIISMKLQPGMPFWMVLNYNPVLTEIVKSVIGSIGMFVSIPLTAFIAVKIYSAKDIP